MKPIIFSTEMVRAILDGRKTQTRRVIKVTNPNEWEGINNCRDSECGASVPCYLYRPEATEGRGIHYPRYDVGDNLWVRETFCEIPYEYERIPIGGGHITLPKYAYRADSKIDYTGIWRPSIHMPREAARLFLLVKAVRVERLQDINEEDAIAEGAVYTDFGVYTPTWKASLDGGETWHPARSQQHDGWHMQQVERPDQCYSSARLSFAGFWDKLYARRGHGWDTNPWVEVITFEQTEVAL